MLDPIQMEDRPPMELFEPGEKEDLMEVIGDWLNANDPHDLGTEDFDSPEDMYHWYEFHYRVGKLYYIFTGHDFLCGHGYITSFNEGRV